MQLKLPHYVTFLSDCSIRFSGRCEEGNTKLLRQLQNLNYVMDEKRLSSSTAFEVIKHKRDVQVQESNSF